MHVRPGKYTNVIQRDHFHLSCLRKLLNIMWQDKIPDAGVMKKAKTKSVHSLLKLAQLRWTDHAIILAEENFRKDSALKVAKRNATKTPLRIKDFNIPTALSPVNRLHRHRIEQSGIALSTEKLHSLKQREIVKQEEGAKKGKQVPTNHHQHQHSQSCNRQFR